MSRLPLRLFFPKPIHHLVDCLGIRQKIAKKIGYGYALAIGMGICGTTIGLWLGSYYSQKAQQRAELLTQKQELLEALNSSVLGLQLHPLRLLAVNSLWREYEINQFTLDLKHLRQLLVEVEQFAQTPTLDSTIQTTLNSLSQEYRDALQVYEGSMVQLWEQTDRYTASSTSIITQSIVERLSNEASSQLSLRFETLSEDLTRLRQRAEIDQQQAIAQLSQAQHLRLIIIVASIVLSSGIAIALAIITSQAIARPIETVTAVAHQVTKSGNFSLQAPITTQDEVALLTQALNQLIDWAGEYTDALERSHHTLEERVEERTLALQQSEEQLRQQTVDLQATLTELQQAQLHLIQSEKMSSLGQMVAGVAHEINNPIGFIYGNLSHVQENTEDLMRLIALYQEHYPSPHPDITDEIETIDLDFVRQDFPALIDSLYSGATRIKEIVASLRIFARLDESSVKTVNIHDGLDSTLTILNNRLKSDRHYPPIRVIKKYGQLPSLECHAGQLNQVFMNIFSNAIDALHERCSENINATISLARAITSSVLNPDAEHHLAPKRENAEFVPTIEVHTEYENEWVVIQIIDNGAGMKHSTKQRLFDPFFTTKEVGKGTGLGLSVSYQIVTQTHHGKLICDSTLGEGTTFTIKLPTCVPV
ncbi:MAG: HAMP domain-containing protein [Symploca sp. SIO2B6]|nr:HAMP domain-containing protein [Symploca sp. SIO2B6]